MATQEETEIPISYTREQAGLRLLELPPELVEMIEAGQTLPLYMKSTPSTMSNKPLSGGHAVLCTADKTYELKQVQTSNTVLILRPSQGSSGADNETQTGLEAYATCSSTLQLAPLQPCAKTKTTVQHLRDLLPVYSENSSGRIFRGRRKVEILDDVPYSAAECEEAWDQILAFEFDDVAYRPSERMLVGIWRKILAILDFSSTPKLEYIFTLAEHDDYPEELIMKLMRRLGVDGESDQVREISIDALSEVMVDQERTLIWLASIINSAYNETRASAAWQELVPPYWLQEDADAQYAEYFKKSQNVSGTAATVAKDATAGVKRIGKSKNWHEKFKKQKK